MLKKKKSKLKKSVKVIIILLIILIVIILLLMWPLLLTEIKIYGDSNMIIDYGEDYSEPGYRGKYFGKNITDEIIVNSNIKEQLGNYYIEYKYKPQYAIISVVKKRKVVRKDISRPNLTLNDGDKIEITINTEYKEPGYTAIDNYDGDITDKVIINGQVDTTKLGEYNINYEVTDSYGNKTIKTRVVTIEKLRPTQMSVKEFNLDGWYDDAKLKETSNKGESYYNSFKLVGDSNVMHMYYDGLVNGNNAWAVPCLHAESMFSKNINIYGAGEEILLLNAIKKYKPSRIILNFGSFSTSWITEETFKNNANSMIENIQNISPNTKIILISIYPIDKKLDGMKFEQNKINKYNFYILEMAYNHNIKFLDVSSVLKNSEGYVSSDYIRSDGYHLSYNGYKKVKDYIMTHAIEEE